MARRFRRRPHCRRHPGGPERAPVKRRPPRLPEQPLWSPYRHPRRDRAPTPSGQTDPAHDDTCLHLREESCRDQEKTAKHSHGPTGPRLSASPDDWCRLAWTVVFPPRPARAAARRPWPGTYGRRSEATPTVAVPESWRQARDGHASVVDRCRSRFGRAASAAPSLGRGSSPGCRTCCLDPARCAAMVSATMALVNRSDPNRAMLKPFRRQGHAVRPVL